LIAQVRGPGYRVENRWNWDFRIRHGGGERPDLKFAAPAENKAVFFGKRPPSFSPNLSEQSLIWKTLLASEFQQKARGAVQQDSTRPVSMPLPNVALMSVAWPGASWI
jgi:hypothetical protein